MIHLLHLINFNKQKELEASVKEFFTLKANHWYQQEIKELAEIWLQTLQHDGLDLEC